MWLGVDPSNRNLVSKVNERAWTSHAQSTEGASKNVVELFHLANLDSDNQARQVLDIEVANKIEGIVAQNMEHINKLGFKEVCQLNNISQWSFKSLVRKYINKNKT